MDRKDERDLIAARLAAGRQAVQSRKDRIEQMLARAGKLGWAERDREAERAELAELDREEGDRGER